MGCGSSNPGKPLEVAKTQGTVIHTSAIKDVYEFGPELGTGSFARVVLGIHRQSKEKRAIKIIDRAELAKSHTFIEEEIDILSKVGDHHNIIKLWEAYTDKKSYYLVMDLCQGGDLFSKIIEDGHFTEKDAAEYCRQLASALQYMHSLGVTHRDLKPENLLLANKGKMAPLKVADFGLSKVTDPDHKLKTVCGTWAYAAPEVILRKPYSNSVDNWSLGVLQFVLLAGYHPFDVYGDLTEPQLLNKIIDCKYDFNDKIWERVSKEAKGLINKLLQPNPVNRLSLEEYLAHPWVKGQEDVGHKSDMPQEYMQNMSKFLALVNAQKAARILKNKARAGIARKQSLALEEEEAKKIAEAGRAAEAKAAPAAPSAAPPPA